MPPKVKNDGRKLHKCTLRKVELVPGMTMQEYVWAEGNRPNFPTNPPIQDSQIEAEMLAEKALELIKQRPCSLRRVRELIGMPLASARRSLNTLRLHDRAHLIYGLNGAALWKAGPKPTAHRLTPKHT
jgi:hypothetical protein